MHKQICLISAEIMPNIIGILHDSPSIVVPVVTRKSLHAVKTLASTLAAAGCRCTVEEPIEVLPYDLDDCKRVMSGLVDSGTAVNWTGGTKVMALAAYQVAAGISGCRRLYINTEDNEIIEETEAGTVVKPIDSNRLGLNVIIQIMGSGNTFEDGLDVAALRQRHEPDPRLVDAATKIWDARNTQDLHGLSLGKTVPLRMSPAEIQSLVFAKLIESSKDGRFQLHYETLTRPFHRETPQQANGGFLSSKYVEVFVWSQLKHRGAFDDVLWHVEVNPHRKGKLAEFDVVVFNDNRFLVIDCKAGVSADRPLASLIEETSGSTRKVGRIFSKWAVYINKFEHELSLQLGQNALDSQKERAADFGGILLFRDQLDSLHTVVAEFMARKGGLG